MNATCKCTREFERKKHKFYSDGNNEAGCSFVLMDEEKNEF
jgi:hypothetical protein